MNQMIIIKLINDTIKDITDIIKDTIDKDKTKIKEENKTQQEFISADREKTKMALEVGITAIKNAQETTTSIVKNSKDTALLTLESSNKNQKENMKFVENVTNKAYEYTDKNTKRTLDRYDGMLEKEKKENLQCSEDILNIKEKILGLRIKEEIERDIYGKLYNKQQISFELQKEKKKLAFEIDIKLKEIEPFKEKLNQIEIDLKINTSHFNEKNIDFEKQMEIIEKLIFDYKDSMNEKEFNTILSREKRELNKIIDAISNYEQKMLNNELRKLTKKKKIEPFLSELEELEKKKFLINLELENEQKLSIEPFLYQKNISNENIDSNIIDVKMIERVTT